jgi:endonuclease/exonuclease/phosphatase family metal-dependent hydrolase
MTAAPPPRPGGSAAPGSPVVVANFNVHAGIDGWGRPFDVVAACRSLDADVLALEETWTPEGAPGLADEVAATLGYRVVERALATGRRALPHPGADHRWMRPLDWRGASHAIYLDSERPLGARTVRTARYREAEPGSWGIAVLSRLPVVTVDVVELGRLPRDRSTRAALVVDVAAGGGRLTVVATHMSHLTYGSPLHFVRLNRLLERRVGDRPAVLVGDMNLWGPPVTTFFHRWHRALRQRTWPAWRPHSQVDHMLVRGGVQVLDAEVRPMAGSDHRPVRASLALRAAVGAEPAISADET